MDDIVRTERLHIIPNSAEDLRFALDKGFEAAAASRGLTLPAMERKERRMRRSIYSVKLDLMRDYPNAHKLCTAWQIVLPEFNVIIGEMGFKGPPTMGSVEIGYGLHPDCRRMGYMTEAVAAMCTYAFTQEAYKVDRVVALTRWRNKASQGVLLKNGFTRKGWHSLWLMRWEKASD